MRAGLFAAESSFKLVDVQVEAQVVDAVAEVVLWAVVVLAVMAAAVAFSISRTLSAWQSLQRRLRCTWTTAVPPQACFYVPLRSLWTTVCALQSAQRDLMTSASTTPLSESRQPWRQHVLVHIRGCGKRKTILCEAEITVGAMRKEIGGPLNEVILLVPGHRELDDEMRVGEIVREGPMTVEVRCRGVGGGKEEDRGKCVVMVLLWLWLSVCVHGMCGVCTAFHT